MSAYKFWIVAAGTGGHIIPGLEIAKKMEESLEKRASSVKFLFWGTSDRLEAKLIPQAGRKLKTVAAKPWKGMGLKEKISGVLSIFFSIWAPIWDIIIHGRPTGIVSVGGYVSIPIVFVGVIFRIPIFIHEPNIKTGMANKLWGKYAKLITTIPGSDANELFKDKVFDLGNPVADGFSGLSIRSSVKTIVILGGSQGARSLCLSGLEVFKELLSWDKSLRLILQSGIKNLEESQKLAEKLEISKQTKIYGFVKDMPMLLSVADIVIARAGAMTLSELSITGAPTVLVPFPHAADDHQRINAKILEKAGAVRVVEEGEGFERSLSAMLRDLIMSEKSLKTRIQLSENFKKFSRPKAGQDIAEKILSLIT